MNVKYLKRRIYFFFINKVYVGTSNFEKKRKLMLKMGYKIGDNTKIVGPITVTGELTIGDNCWIGAGFSVFGNGYVQIGDNCDLAPNVSFFTGGHEIGDHNRRAGKGENYRQIVCNGVWICGNTSIVRDVTIGEGSVIAAGACVVRSIEPNQLVGGVPAKVIRVLDHEY